MREQATIVDALLAGASQLDEVERALFEALLASAARAGLDPAAAKDGPQHEAQALAKRALAAQRSDATCFPPWRGQPDFLAGELLAAVCAEADELRPHATRYGRHMIHTGGRAARRLCELPELRQLIEAHAGPVSDDIRANFTYYVETGDCIDPHTDVDAFGINALMVLRHDSQGLPTSALHVVPPDGSPERSLQLGHGELFVFRADRTLHYRTPTHAGERVLVLSLGFQPRAAKAAGAQE